MKITILSPKEDFSEAQQAELTNLGEVIYTNRGEYEINELINLAQASDILALDPDNLGGFEKAQEGRLTQLLESLPNLKGVALSTTAYGWIDLEYCNRRSIAVTHVPFYSTESVAEHVLALFICLAKKIIITDRRTQKGEYKMEMGFELKGKTLGVIGLGHIGTKVAELGNAIGMKVVGYNKTPKQINGIEIKSLEEVLKESDVISINLADSKETTHFISKNEIENMKKGAIVVNLASREIVDEEEMAKALLDGRISSYAYEGEDLSNGPLSKIETAIGLKPFAWFTKEALDKAMEIWTENIVSLSKGTPKNKVSL